MILLLYSCRSLGNYPRPLLGSRVKYPLPRAKYETSHFNGTNYIASVGVSTDSARGKEYLSSKLNRIKFNWRLFWEEWINILFFRWYKLVQIQFFAFLSLFSFFFYVVLLDIKLLAPRFFFFFSKRHRVQSFYLIVQISTKWILNNYNRSGKGLILFICHFGPAWERSLMMDQDKKTTCKPLNIKKNKVIFRFVSS